jgi:hypothetical protein
MAAIEFDELFDTLKTGIAGLAKTTVNDYLAQATEEGQNALDGMKADIQQWSVSLAAGDMSTEDLKFLVAGRKEIIEMRGLEQVGIAEIQLDSFKNGIVNLIITTVSKVI